MIPKDTRPKTQDIRHKTQDLIPKYRAWVAAGLMSLVLCLWSYAEARNIGYTEDPLKIGIGGRAMGMGGTYVALSDNATAVLNNPAGLASLDRFYFTSMYTSLLGDVNYPVLGISWPVNILKTKGSLGLAYVGSNVSSIISPSQSGFSYFDYHNNVWFLEYGFESSAFDKPIDLGASLKLFNEGFSGSVNYAGTGMDLDLGMKLKISDRLYTGILLRNILPSSLGAKIAWPNGDEEEIPAVIKLGMAVKNPSQNVTFCLDYDMHLKRQYPGYGHAGLEWQLNKALALRIGVDQGLNSGTVANNFTAGVGLQLGNFIFDYAYHPYFEETDALTHYFSFSFFTGKKYYGEEKTKELIEKEIFKDVDSQFWAYSAIKKLKERKIAKGYPGDYYHPNYLVTRAETITMLVRAAKTHDQKINIRERKPGEPWYNPYVEAGKKIGFLNKNFGQYNYPATWKYSLTLLDGLINILKLEQSQRLLPKEILFRKMNLDKPVARDEIAVFIDQSDIIKP